MFAYVGLIQNLKDLKDVLDATDADRCRRRPSGDTFPYTSSGRDLCKVTPVILQGTVTPEAW